MPHVTGAFDVKMVPQPPAQGAPPFGRFALDKRYHGALDATGKGEMMAAMTDVKGSAAYSALEVVDGVLEGRRGTFVIQHTGVMDRGTPSLRISVVPDSGTGELAGLTGSMDIVIEGGAHSYVFEYALGG